ASIREASVVFGSGVEVSSKTREDVTVFVIGGAAGLVGASGAVGVGSIDSTSTAFVRASDVSSLGGIAVFAEDNARLDSNTGALAGGFVGVGGAVTVGSITNTVRAAALGAHLNATGETSIVADSEELIDGFVGTASVGAGALAGAVSINTIETV